MQSDTTLLHKRPRIAVECSEADSSSAELGCGDGVSTQAMDSGEDTHREIVGERIVVLPSWVFFWFTLCMISYKKFAMNV